MKRLITFLFVAASTHFAFAQNKPQAKPLAVVPFGYISSNTDSIHLEEISVDDLKGIVNSKGKVLVHIWYPWCAEQQKKVKMYTDYQKDFQQKGIRYVFISDNKHIATTIPALFYNMQVTNGYVIPLNTSLSSYKKSIHRLFNTKKKQHTVFLFEEGKSIWEGHSYQAYGEKKIFTYINK